AKRAVFVITSFVQGSEGQGDWVYRPRLPGLIPFFVYALIKGCMLLRKNREIKVVLGGSALVTPVVIILARIFHSKAAVYVHGLDLVYQSRLYQLLCVGWIRTCDRVICNSRYTASLAEGKGARSDSIEVIPPGVDTESIAMDRDGRDKKAIGLDGNKVILYAGRLVRRKGVKEFLAHCFPHVVTEFPETCFVIVGENPVESMIHREDVLAEIKDCIREMRLGDRVRLVGWLSEGELIKLYHAADLLVLPAIPMATDVEGFGIVIIEAAAAGTPCVASKVGGIPDAVEDGKAGILVEPGNYKMMSRAVVGLLRDDDLRRTMGAYAQQRAREKFDWSKIAGRYEELFSSLGD
ncbi:MAG: glycosyltransferase family 4 protein, partial [Candidatus Binatia bacterium]